MPQTSNKISLLIVAALLVFVAIGYYFWPSPKDVDGSLRYPDDKLSTDKVLNPISTFGPPPIPAIGVEPLAADQPYAWPPDSDAHNSEVDESLPDFGDPRSSDPGASKLADSESSPAPWFATARELRRLPSTELAPELMVSPDTPPEPSATPTFSREPLPELPKEFASEQVPPAPARASPELESTENDSQPTVQHPTDDQDPNRVDGNQWQPNTSLQSEEFSLEPSKSQPLLELPDEAELLSPLESAGLDRSANVPPPELVPAEDRSLEQAGNANPRAMAIVTERASETVNHGISLASRNAPFSARREFISALRSVAEALDTLSNGAAHGRSLDAGLLALREADDFVSGSPETTADVSSIVDRHQTPILKHISAQQLTPLIARQRYYTYAQKELSLAGGRNPAASRALYGLGKLHTSQALKRSDSRMVNGAQAMVFHRSAMMVDPSNSLAANELGVMLARYGELEMARQTLLHCLKINRMPEAWHNLAIVHERLGEADLAKRARLEWDLERRQREKAPQNPNDLVQWIDPGTFGRMPVGRGPQSAGGTNRDARRQPVFVQPPRRSTNR